MSLKTIYLMVDLETTSLVRHQAPVWDMGIVAFNSAFEMLGDMYARTPVPQYEWSPETWEFGLRTYGPAFMQAYHNSPLLGRFDWRKVWVKVADLLTKVVANYEQDGYDVWIVSNHTDFDVSILKILFDKLSRPFPISYGNSLDVPSLIVAATGMKPRAWRDSVRDQLDPVAHESIPDCISQIRMLQLAGVRLPD